MTLSDLSDKEHEAFMRALRAPALWAFHLLVAEVGLDRALEACTLAQLPDDPKVQEAFERCDYTADDLPFRSDIEQLIQGVRVKLGWSPKKEPLQTAARRVGLTVREAQAALKTYTDYGCKIKSLHALSS